MYLLVYLLIYLTAILITGPEEPQALYSEA